jgi:3-oxoacyl-[acyl-carrier-protein] synthase II
MRALSQNNDCPEQASRPFDAQRDGFVFGEGAVVFTMELLSHATARGAQVYAEVLGGALTSDGFNIVAPEPSGKYASLAITRALTNAHLDADAIDMICAHGTSTRANDRTETAAIAAAFGDHARKVAVSAPKSMTGHLIGAAGALAGLLCALSVSTGVIPPTINYTTPDPECFLDYVPGTAREQPVRYATTNAFGFGGQNCVVVFGRV